MRRTDQASLTQIVLLKALCILPPRSFLSNQHGHHDSGIIILLSQLVLRVLGRADSVQLTKHHRHYIVTVSKNMRTQLRKIKFMSDKNNHLVQELMQDDSVDAGIARWRQITPHPAQLTVSHSALQHENFFWSTTTQNMLPSLSGEVASSRTF